jgi:hypothetical protein
MDNSIFGLDQYSFRNKLVRFRGIDFSGGREQIPRIVSVLSINFSSVAHTGYDYLMSLRVNSIDDSVITVANLLTGQF